MTKQFRFLAFGRRTPIALAILTLIVLLLSSVLPSSAQDDNNVTIIGGDAASMREFIARTNGMTGPGSDTKFTIHIGDLADNLPVDLPLPDDARPIGSITTQFNDTLLFRLIVDTALPPDEIVTFYQEQFSAEPWQTMGGMTTAQGGFVSMDFTALDYCYDEGITVNILASVLPSDLTNLEFHINQQEGICRGGGPGASREKLNAISQLPALETPADISEQNTTSQNMGFEDGKYSALSTATLTSSLTASDMLARYNEQLLTAGWELVQQEEGATAAWSTWQFTDKLDNPWHGTLTITPIVTMGSPETYQAMLHIAEQGNP